MIGVIAVLCMLAMAAISLGQTLKEVPSGISQTVIIRDNSNIRCFYREQLDNGWSVWEEWAPRRRDERFKIFTPRQVNQTVTNKLIGDNILKWLSKRPPVSGYYNFSANENYDWKEFGGDNYGTYSHKRDKNNEC